MLLLYCSTLFVISVVFNNYFADNMNTTARVTFGGDKHKLLVELV